VRRLQTQAPSRGLCDGGYETARTPSDARQRLCNADYDVNRLDQMLRQDIELTDFDGVPFRFGANPTLDDAIMLLQSELERLRTVLETCRRIDHPKRHALVRWHVRRIDRRQDALEKLQAMVVACREPDTPIH